jgi:membrane protease YdiL (CAAX protease family)
MDATGYYLLFLLLGLYPYSAWKSSRKRASLPSALPRIKVYRGTMIVQVVLVTYAIYAAKHNDITLFAPWRPTVVAIMIGAAALAFKLLLVQLKLSSAFGRERARELAPRTPTEAAWFTAMILVAGFAEEVLYRGALFGLLSHLFNGAWWPAALISAIAFGLAHMFQGVRSSAIVVVIALSAQLVVLLTGTLYVAMAVHVIYDLMIGRRHSRSAADLLTN